MTTKKAPRSYKCVHPSCVYRTDKRKSIYSHLLRTHGERKEDFECEYCSAVFTNEDDIETHLLTEHAALTFTYTCVSRLENIINRCAKLATDGEKATCPPSSDIASLLYNKQTDSPVKEESLVKNTDAVDVANGYEDKQVSLLRTKASVNESLNNIAKQPRVQQLACTETDDYDHIIYDDDDDDNDSCVSIESDSECQSFIAKPSGLKIKINLSNTSDPAQSSLADQATPSALLGLSETSTDPVSRETGAAVLSLPRITPASAVQVCKEGVVRGKASKYFDRLEVYHTTDRQGRRCCPFCPYKTTKNTIRVHLSGIHKIFFVKCSLCDYRAAFPHQIYQHGVKFHKTSNLKVIQLSKESRDRVIDKLKASINATAGTGSQVRTVEDCDKSNDSQTYDYTYETVEGDEENDNINTEYDEMEAYSDLEGGGEEDEEEEHLDIPQDRSDQRVFKPPKCQTSKTDYYTIQVENGVYMYNCKMCSFRTPVRSTIYTHKYRHEHKAYKCGYCDFTSAPRSNVVHHCRGKHKDRPICVLDAPSGEEEQSEIVSRDMKPADGSRDEDDMMGTEGVATIDVIKKEPVDDMPLPVTSGQYKPDPEVRGPIHKGIQPLIKVPHYTRSANITPHQPLKRPAVKRKPDSPPVYPGEFKLSMNKLYRLNPEGSPRYMCTVCSFACDTHPKMKHHLYRHRPQQYKCPYCDHRKYPRSYVVRHVRDTHRGKPIRVVDLSEDPSFKMTIDTSLFDDSDTITEEEQMELEDSYTDEADMMTNIKLEAVYQDDGPVPELSPSPPEGSATVTPKQGPATHNRTPPAASPMQQLRQNASGEDLMDDMFTQSSDVSPNFHEAVFTSTPMIESLINRPYEQMDSVSPGTGPEASRGSDVDGGVLTGRVGERKKSVKDYRINSGEGPRYVCNVCNYGTQNYKTIHNHMYRHEAQRYQCPYCGYRRSPRSFVENHIREVHKGQPVVVRELSETLQSSAPLGSPRQTLKRADNSSDSSAISPVPPLKKPKKDPTTTPVSKPFVKWPAPKPASQVKVSPTATVRSPPPLQIHGKPPKVESNLDAHSSMMSVLNTARIPDIDGPDPTITCPPPLTKAAVITPTSPKPTNETIDRPNPFKFKEASRTTFKTMYKCVFDPEVCNHISKDKSKMKQHLFMHVEYKPWTCDFCDMTASQSSHIKNHVRTEHPGVSEMSFKYKRHNYLEKHIESFLSKGLFTVPINEYRAILDMKGNTKTACKKTFAQDHEGFMLCPYCDYKTKSGGITDHVKMKHLQPRFKCHWCDFRAFYKSEVRKHHRKERSHLELEFKIQELDLVEMMAEYREMTGISHDLNSPNEVDMLDDDDDDDDADDDPAEQHTPDLHNGAVDVMGIDDDDDEDSDDLSSNGSSLNEGVEEMLLQYSDQQFAGSVLPGSLNTQVDEDGSMKLVPVVNSVAKTDRSNQKEAKFKCGYCDFSADLRVKVKMHCSKRHSKMQLQIIELASKTKSGSKSILSSVLSNTRLNNSMSLNANDLKGTKFELDLRKAGVSTLNLSSLFPKSKHIDTLSPDSEGSDDSNSGETSEPDNEVKDVGVKLNVLDKQLDCSTKVSHELCIIEIPALDDTHTNEPVVEETKKSGNSLGHKCDKGLVTDKDSSELQQTDIISQVNEGANGTAVGQDTTAMKNNNSDLTEDVCDNKSTDNVLEADGLEDLLENKCGDRQVSDDNNIIEDSGMMDDFEEKCDDSKDIIDSGITEKADALRTHHIDTIPVKILSDSLLCDHLLVGHRRTTKADGTEDYLVEDPESDKSADVETESHDVEDDEFSNEDVHGEDQSADVELGTEYEDTVDDAELGIEDGALCGSGGDVGLDKDNKAFEDKVGDAVLGEDNDTLKDTFDSVASGIENETLKESVDGVGDAGLGTGTIVLEDPTNDAALGTENVALNQLVEDGTEALTLEESVVAAAVDNVTIAEEDHLVVDMSLENKPVASDEQSSVDVARNYTVVELRNQLLTETVPHTTDVETKCELIVNHEPDTEDVDVDDQLLEDGLDSQSVRPDHAIESSVIKQDVSVIMSVTNESLSSSLIASHVPPVNC